MMTHLWRGRSLRNPPAACTIVARNYLSYARVVGSSYLRHHPGARFYALVVDGLPEGAEIGGGITLIPPEALALRSFDQIAFKYSVTELCTAVKPTFLSVLLAREREVVYLDPDILVMRPLVELGRALRQASIVITPHALRPIPMDGRRPSERGMLVSGVYNLGFLGLARSRETAALLRWWEDRLRDDCRVDFANGLFTDQKWIDLVPGYFASTTILRDPTYNVAYWNLHERTIERRGPQFLANGCPIGFFHFSGFDPSRPDTLSKYQTRTEIVPGTALSELVNLYADLQIRMGHRTCSAWEYAFSRFDNGVMVSQPLRALYLSLTEEERERFGNPFGTSGTSSFLEWATRPRSSGLSPFLESVYRLRADVAATFPDPYGRDREAYLHWAWAYGPGEIGYEPDLARACGASTPA